MAGKPSFDSSVEDIIRNVNSLTNTYVSLMLRLKDYSHSNGVSGVIDDMRKATLRYNQDIEKVTTKRVEDAYNLYSDVDNDNKK
jgi:hypothetical protein